MERIGPGSRVGNIEIDREIGRGAFAVVYHGRDAYMHRDVALKVLQPPGDVAEAEPDRLLAEARLLGSFQSPHIVTIHAVHRLDDGRIAFEMEYVDGGTFEEFLRREPREPVDRGLGILRGVARALELAHQQGVVHGDLKPSNILVTASGEGKLADFGLARLLLEQSVSGLRVEPAGTALYMAPEVVLGNPPQPVSDLWSYGVMLYQVLCGRHPFPVDDLSVLLHAVLHAPPGEPPRALDSQLAALLRLCLEKTMHHRVRSATQILELLTEGEGRIVRPPAPPPEAPRVTPLGRATETRRLGDWLARVEGGKGGGLLLAGEAGIGKSTLLAWVDAQAREKGFAVLSSKLAPMEGLRHAIMQAARPTLDDSALQGRLGDTAEFLKEHQLVENSQFLWAFRQLLDLLVSDRPLLLVLDDLHHASRAELRVLADLAAHARGRRIGVAAGFRLHETDESGEPGWEPTRHLDLVARPEFEHIDLGPLTPDQILRLVERAQGDVGFAPVVARRVTRLAGGNPLFALEVVRHLRERGAIEVRGGLLQPARAWTSTDLPDRVRGLVARRIDALPELQRTLVDVAAVDGFEFDGAALAHVLELPVLRTLRLLQGLYRDTGLVQPARSRYGFSHPLIHEVIVGAVALPFRTEIHRRLAEYIEGHEGEPEPARLGLHWAGAGRPDRARPHLFEAARRAGMMQDNERVLDLFAKAGLTPENVDPVIVREYGAEVTYLASALVDRGESDRAETVLDRVLAIAREDGNRDLERHALLQKARALYPVRGLGVLDPEFLERAEAELRARPPTRDLATARYSLGVLAKARGDLDEAERWFHGAEEVSRRLDRLGGVSDALDQLATIANLRGDPDRAQRLYAEAAELSERVGRRLNAAISRVNRALTAFQRGELPGVREDLERAVHLLELQGARETAAQTVVILGHVLYAAGEREAATRRCRQAEAMLQAGRHIPGLLMTRLLDAELAMACGAFDRAEAALDDARALAREAGRVDEELRTDSLAIRLCGYRGDADAARSIANRAFGLTQERFTHLRGPLCDATIDAAVAGSAPGLLDELPSDAGSRENLRRAARAWFDDSEHPAALEDAARALRGEGVGERRAASRVLGRLLGAEALRRRGDVDPAVTEARGARHDAETLGHEPYTRLVDGWLARWVPDPPSG